MEHECPLVEMRSFFIQHLRGSAELVNRGSQEYLYSRGVTQGNPLSMFMYTVNILLLILSLKIR